MVDASPDTKPRVLLVEDSETSLLMMAGAFEQAGAEVIKATSGPQALEEYQKAVSAGLTFDLISLDIRMPEMNGNVVASKLREANYKGKIVAFTANATLQGRCEGAKHGIDSYFNKGVLNKDLARSLLEQTRS